MPVVHPPVQAPIVLAFEYRGSPFAAGLHRGLDLGAASGRPVLAPCSGTVAHAGPTPAGPAVTLICGRRRVTLLPVARIGVGVGARVPDGAGVGVVGRTAGHAGLHLGVRRAGDPFGYVDPAPLLRGRRVTPPLPLTGPRPGLRAPRPPRAPAVVARRAPAPRLAPARLLPAPAAAAASSRGPAGPLAPWPVWAGAALALLGAAGGGVRRRRRVARAGRRAGRRAAEVRSWVSESATPRS